MEQLRATEREVALVRERDTFLKEVEVLKRNNSAITDDCKAEKAEKESIREQMHDLQKELQQLKLQLNKENGLEQDVDLSKQFSNLTEQLQMEHCGYADASKSYTPLDVSVKVPQGDAVCTQEELTSDLFQQDTCDPGEKLQAEGSECLHTLGLILKALEKENMVLVSQLQELDMSCNENISSFRDASTCVTQHKDNNQQANSLVPKEDDVSVEKALKTSDRDKVLQETCDLEEKLQTERSECLDTLRPKVEALESHNKVLSNEVEWLKMSFERIAVKYMAEKRENEDLQNTIQALNIKLQNQMDLCTEQQLKASEREKVLGQQINDLREALQKGCDEDSNLQAWEKERKTYLQEMEDLKLCYEGKTLRFNDMFEKLKAEKNLKEAIKEEQFKRIQALNIKVKQQQDSCTQQKVRASEMEQMLSLKVEELQEKISCYEKGPELPVRFNTEYDPQPRGSGMQEKPKNLKGWKKFAYNVKPWHGGKK